MTEGGYFEQKRLSPTGVAVVVLLHGAALTALLTAKGVEFVRAEHGPFIVHIFKDPPPPPPIKQPPRPKTKTRSVIETVKPIVPVPTHPDQPMIEKTETPPLSWTPPGNDNLPPPPPPPPPQVRDPVRTEPRLDPRSELQPPYPASAQREGAEGSVEIRLVIGADGRVKAVEKLRASRDDFYTATERQALHYWRFKPATVDGRPVESSRTMTVRFRLDDLG